MAEGNGHRFKVALSGAVREGYVAALRQADSLELAAAADRAMREVFHRLRTDAHRAGEPLRELHQMRTTIRKLAVAPLYVEYAVHNSAPVVFIRRIALMAATPPGS